MVKYEIRFYDLKDNIVGRWADSDKEYITKLYNDTIRHDKENIYDLLDLGSSTELYGMDLVDNGNDEAILRKIF